MTVEAPTLSLFDYYTGFVSVVLGLAVTDIAVSLHKLLVARARVRWRLIPILGVMAVFGLILAHFFRLWNGGQPMTQVTYYDAVLGVVYALILFLLAASSLPDEIPAEGIDLEQWYFGNRAYLFGLATVLQLWDGGLMLRHIVVDHLFRHEPPPGADVWTVVRFGLAALVTMALMRWRSRVLHIGALALLLVTIHFGYGIWTIRYPLGPRAPAAKPAAAVQRVPTWPGLSGHLWPLRATLANGTGALDSLHRAM